MKKRNLVAIVLMLFTLNSLKSFVKEPSFAEHMSRLLAPPPPTICGLSIAVSKDLVADFGAVGNGIADDSPAFLRAADWINSNWNNNYVIELYIPAGNYKVGVQLAPGASYAYGTGTLTNSSVSPRLGFDMLKLNNVKNVYIHGDPGMTSRVIYKSGMLFGGMFANGASCNASSGCSNNCNNNNLFASVGMFLNLQSCSCVRIEDLSLEGNAGNCVLKGAKGSGCVNDYQIAYDGIVIFGGSDITINNTNCIDFGRDGLMTKYQGGNPTNITLTNLNCIRNCRQGFSFCSGDNIQAQNCKFNLTGAIFKNNPGSGLDIEPEIPGTCLNSRFANCEFKDNISVGMISDNHSPNFNVINIRFDTCEFVASKPGSWSVWPAGMSQTIFWKCTIRGQFLRVSGPAPTDQIKFLNCFITDWDGSSSNPVAGWNGYLMNFGAGYPENTNFAFGGCIFDIHHSLLVIAAAQPTTGIRTYEACTFNFHYADMQSTLSYFGTTVPAVPFKQIGVFLNCYFYLNTFLDSSPTVSMPSNSICYQIAIPIGNSASYDNISYGSNTFPQNGSGGNPWSRIVWNNAYPSAAPHLRTTF